MEKRDKLGEIIEEVAKVLFFLYIFLFGSTIQNL
jgi:hypothetical protein